MEADSSKKNILIISAISPFPADSGGATRIYNTIKHLSGHYNLYFLLHKNPKYRLKTDELDFLLKNTIEYYVFDLKEEKTNCFFGCKTIPYWFSNWFDSELILGINKIISTHAFDFIQVETTQLGYLIDYLPADIPKSLTAYDVCFVSFLRRLKETRGIKTKFTHFFLWLQIYIFENKYLSKYNFVTAMSSADDKFFKQYLNLKNTFIVPNGIEKIEPKISAKKSTLKLGYIGSFNHPPNYHAFKFFVNQIAPLLEKKNIKYEFILAGNNKPEDVRYLVNNSPIKNKKSIKQVGFIKDLRDFYQQIDLLITPIFSGSGTRLKILESLSFSTPVISTTIGAEGINSIDPKYLMIADTAQDFYKKISTYLFPKTTQSLVKSPGLRKYLWSNIFKSYYQVLNHRFQ
ncbi:MAG: glycosyltransferase [Candidatus Shapirobacteria bacterium]|jgi:glycosyltransferase involved in cell wall biosynthesis